MTQEQAETAIFEAGFRDYQVYPPSPETRGQWVIRIKSNKGWKYLRINSDAGDPASQLAAWVGAI